ncbi:uncharacterized protein L203_102485 [Cryptococcus depauperatus CBS 7841]|uniref:Uncharacterized protein n=1 Tax=Cryptococcus depauperatus CBS 7841 TaxID=1295531 RepID=A0AAJ8JRT5_9TREE
MAVCHCSLRLPTPSMLLQVALMATLALAQTQKQSEATPTNATSNSTSSSTSTASDASDTSTNCSYNGNVGQYLSCARSKISTPTLIGAGIGITAGIFVLAFGCIWLTRRKRKNVHTDHGKNEEVNTEKGRSGKKAWMEESEDEDMIPAKLMEDRYPRGPPKKPKITKSKREQAMEEPDSPMSDLDPLPRMMQPRKGSRDTIYSQRQIRPAAPSGATALIRPIPEAGNNGSPQEGDGFRSLYPSNPSPNPRHLTPQPGLSGRLGTAPTHNAQPAANLAHPPPAVTKRSSVHSRGVPLRGASNPRPPSTVSFAKQTSHDAKSNLNVPPIPEQHRRTTASQQERPPTRIMRAESNTPILTKTLAAEVPPMPNSLPSDSGNTAPLKIRKSVAQSNYIPSYYQSASSTRPDSQIFTMVASQYETEVPPALPTQASESHGSSGPNVSHRKPSSFSSSEEEGSGKSSMGSIAQIPPYRGKSVSKSEGKRLAKPKAPLRRPSGTGGMI